MLLKSGMTDPEKSPSLETLGSEIEKFREKTSPPPRQQEKGFGFALRVGVELMSGAFVGGVAGYFLDKWLNTSPVFLIVCFFLGSGGGFMNVVRALNNTKGEDKVE